MRISDWSSDVCSSDLACRAAVRLRAARARGGARCGARRVGEAAVIVRAIGVLVLAWTLGFAVFMVAARAARSHAHHRCDRRAHRRSEEHTSELQSLMRISYAVFCLKKKNNTIVFNHD